MTFTEFEVGRIREQFTWLIKLRWFAVFGVVTLIFVTFAFSLHFPFSLLLLFLVGLILHNLTASWLPQLNKTEESSLQLLFFKRITIYQIVIDLILLTIFLHFSSGIENPFFLFYLFHAVLTSILFPYKTSIIVGGFIVLLFAGLVIGEYVGFLAHFSINPRLNYFNDIYIITSVFCAFSIVIFILMYLSGNITRKLRSQEKAFYLINGELTSANEELARKDKIKNEYVSRVTHDIKGHLASIQTLLAVIVLQDPKKTENIRLDFIKKAYNRTLLLNEFIKDLLRLTSLRLSNMFKTQNFFINGVLFKIYNTCLPIAEAKSISLVINANLKLEISGDFTSIEEAISNIVNNAIKYTPEKGEVRINLSRLGEKVCIEISDTGYGIPEDELEHIFEEFYRAKNTQALAEGTGLGLSLVKQIVERHGGQVLANSSIGEGTTFTVFLPLTKVEPLKIDD